MRLFLLGYAAGVGSVALAIVAAAFVMAACDEDTHLD